MATAEDAVVISNPGSTPPRPSLSDGVRRGLRVKHYSLRTEPIYLYWIRRQIDSTEVLKPANNCSLSANTCTLLAELSHPEILNPDHLIPPAPAWPTASPTG